MKRQSESLLFIVNDAGFFLSHRLNIARAAKRGGWTVHVATPRGRDVERVVAEGFVHHPIPLSRSGTNLLQEFRSIAALWTLLRALRPTLVHAVTIKPVLYSGFLTPLVRTPALVQAVSGLGHVFTAEGAIARVRRTIVKRAYRLAFRHPHSRVIVQNEDDQQTLGTALRKGQAVLIPGAGVDTGRYCALPEPGGIPIVVLASRMLWAKGVGDFVSAAQAVKNKGIEARFVLVGDSDRGNPAAVPEANLREWDELGWVEWWGHRADMPDVFAQATIVCLPTFYGEGVPKVLIEAAACGRPIVTTDWPGCRTIVRDGHNGLLVPPRDAKQLSDALSTLLSDRELRSEMGERGRQMVLNHFATEHIERMTLQVYDELVPVKVSDRPSVSGIKTAAESVSRA